MLCENINCNIEHNGNYGSGRFCSKIGDFVDFIK